MKKIKNPTDMHQKQGQELSKKLYRTTSERAKRLDDARSCARTIADLFTPNLQIQRRKFSEYCERLIFSDPVLYGRKGEELLWRKSFYDVVSTAKKLKKKDYTQDDICNLLTHINSGIGYYHYFLAKLQNEFNLDLINVVDFPLNITINNNNNISSISSNTSDDKSKVIEWANNSVHQCLVYLGDLNRYKLEIDPTIQLKIVYRYYLQAINFKPDYGMPHNQMGTLAMNQNNFLDAVYHYMRCLSCRIPFDGTINNLQSLFDKNSKNYKQSLQNHSNNDNLNIFINRFLLLIDIWYFNKNNSKVYDLCHQTCKDLEECLKTIKLTNESCESPIENGDLTNYDHYQQNQFNYDNIFKIITICLLCISKLHKLESQQISTIVAFTLAIYSQLIQNITNYIQESVLNYPLTNCNDDHDDNVGITKALMNIHHNDQKNKRLKFKLRRRKALKIESDSENSGEDDDNDIGNNNKNINSSSDDDDSFVSDLDNVLANSSDDDDDNDQDQNPGEDVENNESAKVVGDKSAINKETTDIDIIKKIKRMDINDMLEIICEKNLLPSIKILNDWLMQDNEIIKSCGTNTRILLKQITTLLNLININLKHTKLNGINIDIDFIINNELKIPLSEDIILKGTDILTINQKRIDWNFMDRRCMNIKEESIIRIIKFLLFGKFLTTIEETGISFDQKKNLFVCKSEINENNKMPTLLVEDQDTQDGEHNSVITTKLDDKESNSKGQLLKMKHMGQLWLASEVKALENRVKGKTSLSPYLVLDTDALIKYTFMVKHLVHSRKFIVLIPSAVVSALDDLKRQQSEARDAIRWLENQFHRGNRFFRAQRPQERAPIPFIKYPKKKDKEMCTFIEIIECCYYLAEQQKGASNLVTLLIGNQNVLSNGENKDFSYVGLAQSAGITIESVTQFYGKWKKSYKGRR